MEKKILVKRLRTISKKLRHEMSYIFFLADDFIRAQNSLEMVKLELEGVVHEVAKIMWDYDGLVDEFAKDENISEEE